MMNDAPAEKITHVGAFIVRSKSAVAPGVSSGGWQVLLVKRKFEQPKYFLPGGRVDLSQSEIAALNREVSEETDLENLVILADLGVVKRRGVNDEGLRYPKVIRYYLMQSSDARLSEWQSQGKEDVPFFCSWQPLTEFKNLIQFEPEKILVDVVSKFLKIEFNPAG